MNPANIPAQNPITRKRGRKRAPFDPTVREIVAEMEVRGTTLSNASALIAGNDEHTERARYAHRQIVKPDASSTDRQLPLPVMCREAILDKNYQLCGACGDLILNDETCVVAPVLIWGNTRWLLYFHPACALNPSRWTKRIYAAMRVMDAPCEYAVPERARHVVYDPFLRSLVDFFLQPRPSERRTFYGLNLDKNPRIQASAKFLQIRQTRTLTFVPFRDGNTRESVERFVDVLECDGFTSLHDEKYCRAQFQIMRRSMEKEFTTDDYGLDRANLVRLSDGGRRVVTQDLSSDDDSSYTIAVPVQDGPIKSGHPVFPNFVETEFVEKLDAGTLGRDAEIAFKITTKEIEKIVVPERPYEHVPVLCGTDQGTTYQGARENRQNEVKGPRARFVSEYDHKKIPGEYAAYSGTCPERHDNGEKLSPRPEFEYFLLSCPDLREPASDGELDKPKGPVDELAAKTLDQIKEFAEEWKSRLPGDGRVSFSKWMPNERLKLKVSVQSGRKALEAALSVKWLPGQIQDEVPSVTPSKAA